MNLLRFKNYNIKEAAYGVDAMEETHRSMIGELKKKGNKTESTQAQCSKPGSTAFIRCWIIKE